MARRRVHINQKQLIIVIVLSLALAWSLWLLWGIAQKEERARHAANEAKQELETLQKRHATLEANLEELNTPRGEEATLRETYGVARPGEEVIIVVEDEAETGKPLSWWRVFLGWFGL